MAGLTRMVFLTALGVVCSLAADLRPRALEEDEESLSRVLGSKYRLKLTCVITFQAMTTNGNDKCSGLAAISCADESYIV